MAEQKENKTKRETMDSKQNRPLLNLWAQAERNANVKKLFTLNVAEKLFIAAAVFLCAALLNTPDLMNKNLAASVVNQSTDCTVFAFLGSTPRVCEVTGPEIRSAN